MLGSRRYLCLRFTLGGRILLVGIFHVCSPAREHKGSASGYLTVAVAPTRGVSTSKCSFLWQNNGDLVQHLLIFQTAQSAVPN